MSASRSSADILTEPPPPDADVRLTYGPEPLQFGDLRLPRGAGEGPHPLVVMIHGGAWQAIYNLTHAGHLCVDLAEHGFATWNIEYRRIGDPGGGWPGTGDDVLLALDHVTRLAADYPVDLERVVLMGHSAGGHLAVWSSLNSDLPLRGVISLAGTVDLHARSGGGGNPGLVARLLGGGPDEVPELWQSVSPREHLPWPVRTILVCGSADIHWEQNEATAKAARAAGGDVDFVSLPGADHFELVDPLAPEWTIVRGRIEALVATGAGPPRDSQFGARAPGSSTPG
jgi:acetyl esterase/lipase